MIRSIMFTIATCALLLMSFTSAADVNADGTCGDFEGTGTEADPYIIKEPCQLDEVRNKLDAHYKLAADIDLTDYNGGEWEPIASTGDGFEGSFNGDGHTISGLKINSSDDNIGLFGKVAVSGSIRHVKLEDVNIQGKNNVGGLAGQSSGTIDNAAVSGGSVKGEKHVGGLVGRVLGVSDETTVITNSYASGDVTGTAITDGGSGGLVGIIESKTNSLVEIKNSYASGDVTSTVIAGGGSGGLVGFIKNEKTQDNSTSITDSYASGNVKTGGDGGGLVGTIRNENTQNNSTFITNSYASGEVKVEASGGGLVGYIRFLNDSDSLVDIKNSYASGNVTGEYQLGGLIGVNQINGSGTTSIQHVYSTGNVEGNSPIGGIIGLNAKTTANAKLVLDHSYVKGKVTKTKTFGFGFGGLIGAEVINGTTEISNSYWNSSVYEIDELNNMDSDFGEAITIEDLEDLMEDLTFVSWDSDLWYEFDDHGPILKWANPLTSWELSIVDASLEPGVTTELKVMTTHENDQQFEATKVSTYHVLNPDIVTLEGTTVIAVKGGKATIEATLYGETKQLEIIVDSSDPDAPTITLETDEWTKAAEVKVTVNHNVTSATLADIDKIRVKIGDAPWEDYHYDELPIELIVDAEGLTVIQAQAIDVIGNTSAIAYRTVKISRTGLMLESKLFLTEDHTQLYLSDTWTNQSVTADVYVSHDQGVPIDSVMYSIDDGGTWVIFDAPLDFSTEGEHSLWIQAKDAIENIQNERLIIKIDRTNPVIRFDPDGSHSPKQSVSTQVNVTDEDSGIHENQFRYIWSKSNSKLDETAAWKPFDHLNPLILSGEDGQWYLHIRATDQAGNESYEISKPFHIETEKLEEPEEPREPEEPKEPEDSEQPMLSNPQRSKRYTNNRSNVSELSELNFEDVVLTPEFSEHITEYKGRVANEIDSVSLSIRASDSQATIDINGERIGKDQDQISFPLNEGINTFEIVVNAEDGTEKTYTITIEREEMDTTETETDESESKSESELQSPLMKGNFTDIQGHWAEKLITEAMQKGWVNGYPDGTFKPNDPITRAEFMVMLARALNWEGEGAALTFQDKELIGAWAEHAIAQAVSAGIISGYEDGSFRPDTPITRVKMAVIVAQLFDMSLDEKTENTQTSFADDESIPSWGKPFVDATQKLGILNGREGNRFEANDPATRAEAVVILFRLLERQ